MSVKSTEPIWSISTIIAKCELTFNIHQVAESPPAIDEGIEETEPLIYEFEQEEEETSDGDTATTDENDAINTFRGNILGMILVAVGTGFACTVGAIVQNYGGSLLELMLGRLVIQNIISWFLWIFNPFQIKRKSVNWYGDQPHRVNVWVRGLLWFCFVYLWWSGLELIPIGLSKLYICFIHCNRTKLHCILRRC